MPNLLIELFSEEIPARMQARAAQDLKKLVTTGLVEAGLTYGGAASFATPRRLTLAVEGLLAASPTLREERKGPRVDAPEQAIDGFLRGAGLTRDQLEIRDEKKGQVYFATIEKPGRAAPEIVAEVLENAVRNFPWPKSMRWGSGSLRWVRPLHTILCILTNEAGEAEVVALDIDGIQAGNTTEGHRFLGDGRFAVSSFDDYAAKLKRHFVLLDASARAETIWGEASNMAFAQGMELMEDPALLAEVAGLVEWPVVLMGQIDEAFLGLPPEVLQTSMKEHQKFFSVRNPKTGRIEKFVTVANRTTADHGATILAGNQKVLAARLSDAKFFWENDLRVAKTDGLGAWVGRLEAVTFHNKLGSQAARIARIAALARQLAPAVGADAQLAEQAAQVAKADLSSEMVYEFPELQGLMGRYYATAAGLDAQVAAACQEHYSPLGPSDAVPHAPVSVAVALADKLDTLCGFWAIDEKPTGSKDPYALRRAALGVIRLVLENTPRLPLLEVLTAHLARQPQLGDGPALAADLLSFFHDRLKVFLRDQGLRHDVIDAVLAKAGNDDLLLVVARAQALNDTLATEDGTNLVQGFKRANNILTQAEAKDGVEYSFGADAKFAESDAETALFAALDVAEAAIAPALEAEDFAAAMAAMAALRAPIDGFFEAVQVNSDNDIIRRNRLNLLHRIRTICLSVADLARIEG
ncbi:MAG: glycine--tRNA ligase subunit beta [Lutimaribacter sp.]